MTEIVKLASKKGVEFEKMEIIRSLDKAKSFPFERLKKHSPYYFSKTTRGLESELLDTNTIGHVII